MAAVLSPVEDAVPLSMRAHAVGLYEQEQHAPALQAFDAALKDAPNDPELHNYRARVLEALGRDRDALHAIECALQLRPDNSIDHRNRGVLLRKLAQPQEALRSFDAALEAGPATSELLSQRARTLCELERREEALACAKKILQMDANDLCGLNMQGMALERLGRYDEAMGSFQRMLALKPDQLDALNNEAMIHARQGNWAAAVQGYSRSLELESNQPQARYNRSLVRLALGDWKQGLIDFEGRWAVPPLKGTRPSSAPVWLGQESLAGKTLLLYHEQGFGDTLQCLRYLPWVVSKGATVILGVPAPLLRLAQKVHPGVRTLEPGEALPAHDYQCPLMSLLLASNALPNALDRSTGYLHADPDDVAAWQTRLPPKTGFRVGLLWSGRQYPPINYPRDLSLTLIEPILDMPAQFVSLQKDLSDRDRQVLQRRANVYLPATSLLADFADTAALIESFDLVICVDSAVAHLAGALGKPTWLLNRFASCWRWTHRGTQAPWYPSMQVFRQPTLGDWATVTLRVAAELSKRLPNYAMTPVHQCAPTPDPVATSPTVHANSTRIPIRFVCATRSSTADFFAKSALGRSLPLYKHFPKNQRIELRLFPQNQEGLPAVYNRAIEEARAQPAILVFSHDDVYLSDFFWTTRLQEALERFDVVGLAGNKRRVQGQCSWMYLNSNFTRDDDANLSGIIGHGCGFPELKELSYYGEPMQEVKLLDGVFLGVFSKTLIEKDLKFDERFQFDFYDCDFCRQAEKRGLRLGTVALSIIHQSSGKLGSRRWREAYADYLGKYGES